MCAGVEGKKQGLTLDLLALLVPLPVAGLTPRSKPSLSPRTKLLLDLLALGKGESREGEDGDEDENVSKHENLRV